MLKKKAFCEECRKDVEYLEKNEIKKGILKETEYQYLGKTAFCEECNSELYIPYIEDYNLKALYDEFRKANNIISLEKILEIPKKYNIGKKPLSKLLGWGEITFSRYCDGDMPSKQYSDILKMIYDDCTQYLSILENNKANVTQKTYEKSRKSVNEILECKNNLKTKIETISEYVICKCGDITPLSLQKALYYIQGFYYAFNEKNIFEEDCEAWVHGPVYRKIYFKYNSYKFNPIQPIEICDITGITSYEKIIIDSVIRNLCCYSGKILEEFTHSESPWLNARGDIPASDISDSIIDKNDIRKYFKMIKETYNIVNPNDIEIYSEKMFKQII